MTILYITYVSMEFANSGSSVRPVMMYNAMLELGHNVILVKGNQSIFLSKERRFSIKTASKWLLTHMPEMCYVESPSFAIINSRDYKLIEQVKRKNIPIAYFFRDCYYKVPPNNLLERFSLRKIFANLYICFFAYKTENFLKIVDIVYFPSMRMAGLFGYNNMKQLLPAGQSFAYTIEDSMSRTCIYVGGLSERYGSNLLFDAFTILNDKNQTPLYNLVLICRKDEYLNSQFSQRYAKKPNWLQVYHVSGKEQLREMYQQASVALLPLQPNRYNSFAFSVKFFEYLSFGLPIISAGALEMSKMITEHNLGCVTKYTAEAFAQGIVEVLSDKSTYLDTREHIKVFMQSNLWTHRVEQVIHDLTMLTSNIEST